MRRETAGRRGRGGCSLIKTTFVLNPSQASTVFPTFPPLMAQVSWILRKTFCLTYENTGMERTRRHVLMERHYRSELHLEEYLDGHSL